MAADDKKNSEKKLISEKQRFNYIGFDVFPGKPKDLFKSDTEKEKLIDAVVAKRNKGDTIREDCTLLEDRVSLFDRVILTIASLIIIGTLFFPWFSAYNEIVEETTEPVAEVNDSTMMAETTDSLGLLSDTLGTQVAAQVDETVVDEVDAEEGYQTPVEPTEEVLHSYVAKKKIRKEYSRLSGIGVIISIGSVGSYVFSSGAILMITGVLILLMVIASIGLPIYNLYGLYGLKGNPDQKALALKKILKYNWIPLCLLFLSLIISFLGAPYGFSNPQEIFTSIGNSYSIATFLNSLSYGVLISLAAFILIAVKSVEI